MIWSFGFCVLLPAAIVAFYLTFVAANQYVAETRFAVRGATQRLTSPGTAGNRLGGSALSSLVLLNTSQEVHIVVSYLRSQAVIRDLGSELDLRAMFARRGWDFLSTISRDAPAEKFLEYWVKMVTADVEAVSGIATIRVKTFSPDDSLALANAILARSERLVNDFVSRVRRDVLVRTEIEIRRAARRVIEARSALQKFRDEHRVIDPTGSAKSLFETIVKVRRDRMAAEVELDAALSWLSQTAPRMTEIRARLRAMDEQIRGIEAQLTSTTGRDPGRATEEIRAYELLEFEATMADSFLVAAETALTEARLDLDRQHIYLETFLRPMMPQDADHPRPLHGTIVALLGLMIFWSVAALTGMLLMDRRD
jgi:capsular polysaccharide transport system permease protein